MEATPGWDAFDVFPSSSVGFVTKPFTGHKPDTVEKIAGGHPFPSLELDFTNFEQSLLAANNK